MAAREIPPEFFRAAFEHSVHAIVGVDDQRRVVAANEAAAELLRVPLEELVGRSGADFSLAEHDDQTERLWRILLSGGTFREDVHIVTVEGKEREIRVAGKGNIEPGLHLAILGDVTRRKEHELSSRRYELLREHAHDVLLFIGAKDGRILEANHAAERAYGYTRQELVSMHIRELRHDTSDFETQFRRASESGVVFETIHRRKDGTAFPVEVSSRPTKVGNDDVLLSVIRDITERRELQAKLLEADRLSTFGMMAAGLAHEINNPLAYVLANHEVLARELPRLSAEAHAAAAGHGNHADVAGGLDQCAAMLAVAMEGLERVRAIVRDLKTFSLIDPQEGVLVDLHQVIDAALNVAQSELRHRARLERHYGELSPVRGSTSRLGQVFLNLVVNGAQAIPPDRRGGGLVRVTTSTASDGWACIEVMDDGVGMAPEVRGHLFEPFHTTKPGEGTGLGLYITRTIVEAHGGSIEVERTEGVGTTVRVKLPPYEPTLDARQGPAATRGER
jgi:two-component system NtrC family sensor kinase